MTHPKQRANSTSREAADDVYVVGGGLAGHEAANRLSANGESVTLVTTRTPATDTHPDQRVHLAESLDAESLAAADLEDADAVVVLGNDDARNFLVAQLARTRFDADRVVARVNDPDREPLFEGLGVEVIDTTQAVANTAVDRW
jgi:Trk K+ transport system NAD-binding subunit